VFNRYETDRNDIDIDNFIFIGIPHMLTWNKGYELNISN